MSLLKKTRSGKHVPSGIHVPGTNQNNKNLLYKKPNKREKPSFFSGLPRGHQPTNTLFSYYNHSKFHFFISTSYFARSFKLSSPFLFQITPDATSQ